MVAIRTALVLALLAGAARAEPVALNEALGQGLLTNHRGNCYVLFPAHVAPEALFVSLFTAAPQAAGRGAVYFRRSEADFAFGLVQGSASEVCALPFARLPEDVSGLLRANGAATLERVNPQGVLERLRMRIDRTAWEAASAQGASGLYQYVFAATDAAAGETREVYQGTSGAFLYVGDVPVGMVVTAPDATTVRALRIEEMRAPLQAWLASGSFGALEATPDATGSGAGAAGLAFDVTEWTGVPVEPFGPTGLATGAHPFRAAPAAGAVSFVAELGDAPVSVRSIILSAAAVPDGVSAPRQVRVEIDRSRRGPGDFRTVWSGDMPPDGAAVEVSLATFARRIRVTVLSGWTAAPSVEIGAVTILPSG